MRDVIYIYVQIAVSIGVGFAVQTGRYGLAAGLALFAVLANRYTKG